MDPETAPSCAICGNPAPQECQCEAERLQIALQQAEHRAMDARQAEIRDWVVNHARTHILHAFERLKSARKYAHNAYLSSLPYYSIYVQYRGQPPLHPAALHQLKAQIIDADAELKRGVDADWRASVLRYPEVLDYFYGLVDLHLPSERDPSVASPPFALAGYVDRGFEGGRREKGTKKGRTGREDTPTSMPTSERPRDRRRDSGGYGPTGIVRSKGPPMAPTPPVMPPYAPGFSGGGYFG
ncbi:uncharacterized protein K452DRAFT_353299 [Aplosporella prunicola CBS 121167]|uniref:Uncharacterized protein n=1 Tax=Aplosporella prunicola CBS 121167 TaxID=1176127 RepID=A0A6A6B5M9_9PEZI|nr:uncharacterized protein K452DRAFT_353299 [Aplosporella prunicola CBS 121167]KAF2138071.1 hypothetical protein K452DRAFT_353299 [Aplosporella prunicola CBS 121167]